MDEKPGNERPLFQGIDEVERVYAPEELPPGDPEYTRVRADEEGRDYDTEASADVDEPPDAAPISNVGSNPEPTEALTLGYDDRGAAPGDSEPDAS